MTIQEVRHAATVRAIIRATKGKFAKVTYTNGQGETKTYTVRTGVKKYLSAIDPNFRPLGTEGPIKVFSIFKNGALKRVVLGQDEGTLVHV